jgi:hypothetical protein
MEQFKAYEEIECIDHGHVLIGQITGYVISLPKLHAALASIELHEGVPRDVQGQFNVARNMALYTYFHYAMAPEVQMKTYSVTELALKRRFPHMAKKTLAPLLREAVTQELLNDAGFRHLGSPDPLNSYSRSLAVVLPELRNSSAHGSTALMPDCIGHIEKCADLINQLFAEPKSQNDA